MGLWLWLACGGGDDQPAPPQATDVTATDTTDPVTEIPRDPITITFLPDVFDEEVGCGLDIDLLDTAPGNNASLTDLRFYVSDVDVLAVDGSPLPVHFVPDGVWQSEDVALLDFEDGTGDCVGGTPETRKVIQGEVSPGEYNGIEFTLGVPFELNHALGDAPLGDASLFHSAQRGHHFFDFGLLIDGETNWSTRILSVDCASSGADVAPTEDCERPNVARIRVENLNPASDDVRVRLGHFLADVDLELDTPETEVGCVSDPLEVAECPSAFGVVGLDWETGNCINECEEQVLFRLF